VSEIGANPLRESGSDQENQQPDATGARWLRRHLAAGVGVLTTVVEDGYRGATVTSCTFISAEPLLLLVALELESQMLDWVEQSGSFAISMLPWREQFLADQFAGFAPRASRTFAGIECRVAETGCPIISTSSAWADCRLHDSVEAGDHRCLIGRAVALGRGSGDAESPLVYYRNRYRRLS
jgi:flavin reductase (DIM6/NTAB) family NADH-FMN oxidoreductase RutF